MRIREIKVLEFGYCFKKYDRIWDYDFIVIFVFIFNEMMCRLYRWDEEDVVGE